MILSAFGDIFPFPFNQLYYLGVGGGGGDDVGQVKLGVAWNKASHAWFRLLVIFIIMLLLASLNVENDKTIIKQ